MVELPSLEENKSMLETHFGLRETPFGVTPDPRFFYSHPLYVEVLAALVHGIQAKKGFMLVTGEVGTGKTILLRKVMRHLEARVHFVFVSNSHLTSYGLTELLVHDLGLTNKDKTRLEMIQDLNGCLIQRLSAGRTVALLIDEAQKLSDDALEGLCDLSNLETDEEKLLQIVLVGQPELAIKLSKSALRRIKQRIAIHQRLYALQTINEVEHYIRHRLQIAGYEGPEIFTREAVEAVWHYSGGTPRLINVICDNALAMACAAARRRISPSMIMKTAGGLLLDQAAEAPKLPPETAQFKAKPPAPRISQKQAEANGREVNPAERRQTPAIPLGEAERVFMSRIATKGPPVSRDFFDRMKDAATEAVGPMANRILGDQISALGESRDDFPQKKLGELIQAVSREILNETMRTRFQNTMRQEIAALKIL